MKPAFTGASSSEETARVATTIDRQHEPKADWFAVVERISPLTLAILTFLFGVTVTLAYRPWSQIEVGDPALYDYIAQSILRGQMPYRDVIDMKGPGAPYLSALAMLIGKTVGLRDVLAVRLMNVILVGLLSMVTYQTAAIYLRNRFAAVIAVVVPLMPERLVSTLISGTQPKLPMILFGMLTLLLIAKDRPYWAGFCSMLSCLCWQPGLMFAGAAFLIFSRYLTNWRDWRAAKVVAGAAAPLAVVLSYFYWKGALGDLWSWTITYNYSVFGPEGQKPLGQALVHIWNISRRELHADLILAGLSVIGIVIYATDRFRSKLKEGLRSTDLFRDAILWPPIVYFIFCIIDFQGGADLIPFLPFVGLFAGWFLVETGRVVASNRFVTRSAPGMGRGSLVPAVALGAMLVLILVRTISYERPSWNLREQDRAISLIANYLGPDEKIYVHGTAEILVLRNWPNLNRYIAFDSGADDYVAAQKAGGFEDVIAEIEAGAPKLVMISRLRNVNHRKEIEQWVDQHYDRLEIPRYERVYIRKPE